MNILCDRCDYPHDICTCDRSPVALEAVRRRHRAAVARAARSDAQRRAEAA